jgi:hypothetical protein
MADFNKYMTDMNQKFLQEKISAFIQDKQIRNIFLMADLNDRYDAIKEFSFLDKTKTKTITYNGDAPKSCCHNWDSSCAEYRYKKFTNNDNNVNTYGTCNKTQTGEDNAKPILEKYSNGQKTILRPEHEGYIENYRYRGDKVFGLIPTNDDTLNTLKLFSPNDTKRTELSTESDHELVFGTFNLVEETNTNQESSGGKKKKLKNRSIKKYKKDKLKKRGGNKKSLKKIKYTNNK